MTVDLVVPFSFGVDPVRERVWAFVRSWYVQHLPGFRILVGTCRDDEEWSKGLAVDHAVQRAFSPIVVIADADVLVASAVLLQSVRTVEEGAAWVQPHGIVYRLSRMATNHVLEENLPFEEMIHPYLAERKHYGAWGGGMVVTTRSAYDVTRGIDPRFHGFGGDDISFARALDTLVGPCVRYDFPLAHLWHRRARRRPGNRGSPENEALAARYMIANGDPAAMQAIVDEIPAYT